MHGIAAIKLNNIDSIGVPCYRDFKLYLWFYTYSKYTHHINNGHSSKV
jgi:hypothetical protein